eukprot:TRINITY_DN2463_c0_g1_i1.p3 TRINITY_DN2463_c0_g1~~TRINITY_DN2463_c0_g1_i1.p3  ORF type:complete len:228 (-),score=28.34 TRINITY_DN2463_c0_g1_i1:349-1032(-)
MAPAIVTSMRANITHQMRQQPRFGYNIRQIRSRSSLKVFSQGGFMEGLVNSVTKAIANSPLNEYKIKLAKFQAGDYDEAATKAQVDKYIADNPVLMFSFTDCPFCKNAKSLLDGMGVPYTALELNEMGKEGLAIRAELSKMTSRTSVPNIFIGGKSIGGCNDGPGIMTLNNQGKLVGMLQEAGVTSKAGEASTTTATTAASTSEPTSTGTDAVAEATTWVENWRAKQ